VSSRAGGRRRGDFRVIYEIDEDAKVVLVHRVAHRRTAYRPD
jgi:mRNA-degrading endonuclease RelE of RelBE toxin-antitoxin system